VERGYVARRRGASPQALPEALSGVSPLQTTRKSIYKKYVDNVDNVDNSQGLYLIFTTTPKSIIRDKNVVKLTSPYPILTYLLPSLACRCGAYRGYHIGRASRRLDSRPAGLEFALTSSCGTSQVSAP
jgi:hypothetical protein